MKYDDLLSRLEEYSKNDYTPMHMPGTKRNTLLTGNINPYALDITEIDGFDNLHDAQGILMESMKRASELFGAEESLFLVNGSTAGVMASICGATFKGDNIIVARNCHISVYNAISLNELNPYYICPEYDMDTGMYRGLSKEDFENFFIMLEKCGQNITFSAAVITSPTYEGFTSDIREIADYLHDLGIVLIVDEAHGAHFNFSDEFPVSAVKAGADLVINSIHKTLPSLTQTAIMHINNNLVNRERVRRYWNIFQTTSPSYMLMGSIDRCISIILENVKGNRSDFNDYIERLKCLRKRLSKLKNMHLLETDDISKIIIVCSNGKMLYQKLLNEYKIQLEMASFSYVIAMTSIADTDEYYDKFARALETIDETIDENNDELNDNDCEMMDNCCEIIDNDREMMDLHWLPEIVIKPCEALDLSERIGCDIMDLDSDAVCDRISAVPVLIYPPGSPIVNAGERITKGIIKKIRKAVALDLEVIGLKEGKILCLK